MPRFELIIIFVSGNAGTAGPTKMRDILLSSNRKRNPEAEPIQRYGAAPRSC